MPQDPRTGFTVKGSGLEETSSGGEAKLVMVRRGTCSRESLQHLQDLNHLQGSLHHLLHHPQAHDLKDLTERERCKGGGACNVILWLRIGRNLIRRGGEVGDGEEGALVPDQRRTERRHSQVSATDTDQP